MDDVGIAKAVAQYEAEYPTCVRFADALRVVVSELITRLLWKRIASRPEQRSPRACGGSSVATKVTPP